MSRLENAIRNVVVGIGGHLILLLLQFISRSIFIAMLGKGYLGTNGLFNDILSMLSVAELGLGTAIVYAMYKPMAKGDMSELAKLVNFYRNAYRWIGSIIAIIGVALVPFLRFLIQDGGAGIENLELIYLLILANSVVTYFFSYKITVLTVAQLGYIESLVTTCAKVVQLLMQITFLLLTHSYLIYLLIQLLCTISINVITSRIAEKKFPYVFQSKGLELAREQKKTLFRNVRALLLHRLGSFFVNGTDNIIISKFLGLAYSGIYSNYTMLIVSVQDFIVLIFNALTASVGNLNVLESKEKNLEVFEKLNFMGFWIASFCSSSFFSLFNPFIYFLCKGDRSYLFDMPTVAVIVFNFYLSQMRRPVQTFKSAMGLYWYDRWKPVAESIINIVVSLILVQWVGFIGVIIGTSISTVSVVLMVEPQIIYRYGFAMPVKSYFVKYFIYMLITVISCGLTYYISGLVGLWTWPGFLMRCVICVIIPNGILFLAFHRTAEFRYYKDLVISQLKKRMSQEKESR